MSSTPQPSRRTTASAHHAGPTVSDRAAVRRLTDAGRAAPSRAPHTPTPFPASPVAVSQADGEA